MSVQGGIRRFLLIRVKLNILIFYPPTSSIRDPSGAANSKENRISQERRFIEESMGQEKTFESFGKKESQREKGKSEDGDPANSPPKGEVTIQGSSPRGAHRCGG